MDNSSAPQRIRVGLHVHLYFWVALIGICAAVFLLTVTAAFTGDNPLQTLAVAIAAVGALLAAIWYTGRRCANPDFSYWDGLRLVASYMTMGIGYLSMFIAAPAVIAAITLSLAIVIVAALTRDPSYAPRAFRRVVAFFARHRMYQ